LFARLPALEQICIEIVFNFNADAALTLRKKRGFSLGSGAGSRSRDYQSNPTFLMWNCSGGLCESCIFCAAKRKSKNGRSSMGYTRRAFLVEGWLCVTADN